MSLIYKNKIPALMVGYPTVSDKYNVSGAVLEGTQSVNNGELVTFGSASGGYKKITALTSAKDIAGIVLATNVKVATTYPANDENIATKPGEGFNLCIWGYIAVDCDATAVEADVKEGATVYVTAAGKCTTVKDANFETTWTFTGVKEKHGDTLVAEIYMK